MIYFKNLEINHFIIYTKLDTFHGLEMEMIILSVLIDILEFFSIIYGSKGSNEISFKSMNYLLQIFMSGFNNLIIYLDDWTIYLLIDLLIKLNENGAKFKINYD